MADAIHEIESGDNVTLQDVAALYYATGRPGGGTNVGKEATAIRGIRVRTGSALDSVADDDTLTVGVVLRIPTLRTLSRALHATGQLKTDLMKAGYGRANTLLKRSMTSVVDMLSPYTALPYDQADVEEAYALTAFLDLDGMDWRTAVELVITQSIDSMSDLASQTEASLQTILDAMVTAGSPAALATQGHPARWRAEARIRSRNRTSMRKRQRPFQVPFAASQAMARAQHYEDTAYDTAASTPNRDLARRLARMHRFQGHVIEGNVSVLAHDWGRASQAYQAARQLFHRLAEDVGSATGVDDRVGVSMDIAITTSYKLLQTVPADTETPLDAPRLRLRYDDSERPFKFVTDGTAPEGKMVLLPPAVSGASPVQLKMSTSFVSDYKTTFLNPQIAAGAPRFSDTSWVDPGAFAAMMPVLYGRTVRDGLARAYSGMGRPNLANEYRNPLLDLIAPDGTVVEGWSAQGAYTPDMELAACATDFIDENGDGWGISMALACYSEMSLGDYAAQRLAEADLLYSRNQREAASALYADVICAIEAHWEASGQSFLAADAQTAFGAVANAALNLAQGGTEPAPYRRASQLTTLGAGYDDDTPVLLDFVTVTTRESDPVSYESKVDATKTWFSMEMPGTPKVVGPTEVVTNLSVAGPSLALANVSVYVDVDLYDAYYFEYLHAQAKFQNIALGLNWYGYPDSFVPAWSFEHLFDIASDLANKAVGAERNVFQMLLLWEQAKEEEYLADKAVELAEAQVAAANTRIEQAEADAVMAAAQVALTVSQAAATVQKDAIRGLVKWDGEATQPTLIEDPETGELIPWEEWAVENDLVAFLFPDDGFESAPIVPVGNLYLSAVPLVGRFYGVNANIQYAAEDFYADIDVLNAAEGLAAATNVASAAALATASAERDVALVASNQAEDYLEFLQDQTFSSAEGLETLVALARQVHSLYYDQAHRMAWLAQQAARHESRKTFGLIGWDYEKGEELPDMMRAQFLQADLDALRAEHVAGQTDRLQEVKWTVPLSRLDPGALRDLRNTGTCAFVLRQEWVDREFPGTYLHRLKDLQLDFVGILPPGGMRGVLSMTGLSWVRVPNSGLYAEGETKEDWTTTALAATSPYDNYLMKRLSATAHTITLSEFDVGKDRGVLSVPRGMLGRVENLGLDTGWTLSLPKRANAIEFENVRDLELTFWFLCQYDPLLQQAQDDALNEMVLYNAAKLSAVANLPSQWSAMRGLAPTEGVDVRYLYWPLAGLPADETERLLTNLRLVAGRQWGTTDELTVRVCCESDPVGERFTTTDGAALTLRDVDTTGLPTPPAENADLRAWLNTFYTGGVPTEKPQQRWVIKLDADIMGSAWEAVDEDGSAVTSTSGALMGDAGGIAEYDEGTAWTSTRTSVKVRKNGGTAGIRVRRSGSSGYEVQLGSDVKWVKRDGAGTATTLATAALDYPESEFLLVTVDVFGAGSSSTLRLSIDGIPILEHIDASSPHLSGTVALAVDAVGGSAVEFDDLQVSRLTHLGQAAELLLSEPFTTTLPTATWAFTDGTTAWAISSTGHPRLDLSKLLNLTWTVDYQFSFASIAPVP